MIDFTAVPLETRIDAVWDYSHPAEPRVWLRLAHPDDQIITDFRRSLIMTGSLISTPDWRAGCSLMTSECTASPATLDFINWWRFLIPVDEWVQTAAGEITPLHRRITNPRRGGGGGAA